MTPLPLPTDNLYKFCALSGLVIVLVTIVSYVRLSFEIEERTIAVNLETALLINEQERGLARAEFYDKFIADHNDTTRADLVEETFREKDELYDDHALIAQVAASYSRKAALERKAALLRQWGVLGIVFGLALSLFGFFRWYVLIQKPADDRVRASSLENTKPEAKPE